MPLSPHSLTALVFAALTVMLTAGCDDAENVPAPDEPVDEVEPAQAEATTPAELVFVHGLADVDTVAVSIDGRTPPALAAVAPFAGDPVVIPLAPGKHALEVKNERRETVAGAAIDCPSNERIIVVAAGFHQPDPNKPSHRQAALRAVRSRGPAMPTPGQALVRVINAGSDSEPLDVAIGARDDPGALPLVNVGFLKGTSWRNVPAGRRTLMAEAGLSNTPWLDNAAFELAPEGRHTVVLLGAKGSLSRPRRIALLAPPVVEEEGSESPTNP